MDCTCVARTTRKCGFSISDRRKSVWGLPFTETLVHIHTKLLSRQSRIVFWQKCLDQLKRCHPRAAMHLMHLGNVLRVARYKKTRTNHKADQENTQKLRNHYIIRHHHPLLRQWPNRYPIQSFLVKSMSPMFSLPFPLPVCWIRTSSWPTPILSNSTSSVTWNEEQLDWRSINDYRWRWLGLI